VRQGKGRKDRVAFPGAKARKSLPKYLMARGSTRPGDALWPTHDDGGRLTSSGLQQAL
jgi:site-specific recombinase XerD